MCCAAFVKVLLATLRSGREPNARQINIDREACLSGIRESRLSETGASTTSAFFISNLPLDHHLLLLLHTYLLKIMQSELHEPRGDW